MTLSRFVTKNALRNKRRSILTIASIGVSLLLLTFMMTCGTDSILTRAARNRPAGW